jgi:hypothetical protein
MGTQQRHGGSGGGERASEQNNEGRRARAIQQSPVVLSLEAASPELWRADARKAIIALKLGFRLVFVFVLDLDLIFWIGFSCSPKLGKQRLSTCGLVRLCATVQCTVWPACSRIDKRMAVQRSKAKDRFAMDGRSPNGCRLGVPNEVFGLAEPSLSLSRAAR